MKKLEAFIIYCLFFTFIIIGLTLSILYKAYVSVVFWGFCTFFMIGIVLTYIYNFNLNFNKFYFSIGHEFYYNDENIFNKKTIIKKKKVIRYKRYLKNELKDNYYTIYRHNDLVFKCYELKGNKQFLAIKAIYFSLRKNPTQMSDFDINRKLLIEKIGLREFVPYAEVVKEYKEDLDLYNFVIYKNRGYYCPVTYRYTICNCTNIKEAFYLGLPHWQAILKIITINSRHRHRGSLVTYETVRTYYPKDPLLPNENWFEDFNKANNYVNKSISYYTYLSKMPEFKYEYCELITNYRGGSYYTFVPARSEETVWECASLILKDDYMISSGLLKAIQTNCEAPDYIIDRKIWNLIYKKATNQVMPDLYKPIVEELRPWVTHTINKYGAIQVFKLGKVDKNESYI